MQHLVKIILCFCFWTISLKDDLQAQISAQFTATNLPDSTPPFFAGGKFAWQSFLTKTRKVPDFFMQEGGNLQVTCKVQFIIDTAGQVTDVKIAQPGCCGTDEEAIRVIKASAGHWSPATLYGKPVKFTITQPMIFQVDAYGDRSARVSLDELRKRYDKWIKKRMRS